MMMRLRRIQVRTTRALATKNIAIEKQKEEIQLQAQKLQELNQLKSKLFSVISHDLRGPISTLHALLELLTNNKMTPEEFMLFSHKVKSNINLTQRTLENLLTWSLSQMDGLKTEKKSVNIRPIIEETCKFLDDIAERKTLTLDRRNVSDNIVICDPDQIELILRNLIHNAIKFSKQEGTVIIQTIEENSNCIISIRDNGIGMSQQELETIRGAHEHFTKSGTMEEKGTGLGLMLCQEFIRRNEGTFRVESVVDKGTEVAFSLPLAIIHENA
jgi:signal transduction histidine kinase